VKIIQSLFIEVENADVTPYTGVETIDS
jgi:hypothetical protein